jgi:acetolactate synthase-1/2/3 large subunit
METKGSEAVILSLLEEGVDTIFGYPGGAIMPIYDSLFDYRDTINHILVRHEQGAVHAAEGYAGVTGKAGVCMVTSGPGATNLITGLADAMVDSIPLVCISGQVASPLLGSDAFQETNIIGISMPVTKWNYQVTRVSEIAGVIAKAFYIATTGRPGPVMIDITKDAQFQTTQFSYTKCTRLRSYLPYPRIRMEDIVSAALLLNNAARPLILAGHGVLISQATAELTELAVKGHIPVASTMLGLSAFPTRHPLYAGMLGMHGNYAPNIKTNECDLLIAIGMRFDDRITGNLEKYARQAAVIHIDIDSSEFNKNVEVDVAVAGDARQALRALIPLVRSRDRTEWTDSFISYNDDEFDRVISGRINGRGNRIFMDEVVHLISEKTEGNAIVVTDVGQNQMVAARNYRFSTPRSWITSGGLGTMGFGLPAAIGASVGRPGQTVVAFIGDGGFQMTLQELGTVMQSSIDIKIVIMNNGYLGMVRQWQDMFFDKRYSFTEMVSPDFIMLAKAYGISGMRVTERKSLKPAIDELLTAEGSFLLEIMVEKEDNVFPMVPAGESVSNIRLE